MRGGVVCCNTRQCCLKNRDSVHPVVISRQNWKSEDMFFSVFDFSRKVYKLVGSFAVYTPFPFSKGNLWATALILASSPSRRITAWRPGSRGEKGERGRLARTFLWYGLIRLRNCFKLGAGGRLKWPHFRLYLNQLDYICFIMRYLRGFEFSNLVAKRTKCWLALGLFPVAHLYIHSSTTGIELRVSVRIMHKIQNNWYR